MSKTAISKILPIRKEVPILHLDDVYIGNVIKKAGLSDQMMQSLSICTGFHAFQDMHPDIDYKDDGTSEWELTDATTDLCVMAGLTIFHKLAEAPELLGAFSKLQSLNITDCNKPEKIKEIASRWDKPQLLFIGHEWQKNFKNYLQSRMKDNR